MMSKRPPLSRAEFALVRHEANWAAAMFRRSCAGLRRSAVRATESIRLRPYMAPALVGGVVGVVIGRRLRQRTPDACPPRQPGLLRRLARMTGNLIFGSMLSHVAHAVSSRHSDDHWNGRADE